MNYEILTINPGSTSTKVALFRNDEQLWSFTMDITPKDVARFEKATDQEEWQLHYILERISEQGCRLSTLAAVVGRGGFLHPVEGGVYEVNERMYEELKHSKRQHASNLGAMLALKIAQMAGTKAYIADPVVVDEMQEVARYSGLKELPRISCFHALNQRATARRFAAEHNLDYDKINLIVAHIGGGISVGIHRNGRVIDTTNALNGEGPVTPERAGSLPAGQLVELCFSGKYTEAEIKKMLTGKGGVANLYGTSSMIEVARNAEMGDAQAQMMLDVVCYTTSKFIGAMSTVVCGEVDAILLTGGVAYNNYITEQIGQRCGYIAPIYIYAGENELRSMAENALGVLQGKIKVKEYK